MFDDASHGRQQLKWEERLGAGVETHFQEI